MAQESTTQSTTSTKNTSTTTQATAPVVVAEPKVMTPTLVETKSTSTPMASGTVAPTSTPTAKEDYAKTQTPAMDFDSVIARLKVKGTQLEKSVIAQLEEYRVRMQVGKPMTSVDGTNAQIALWRLLSVTVERSGEEFPKVFGLILAFFDFYKDDVFHEKYVFRFMESLTISHTEITAFQRLINLIKIIAGSKNMALALKQVDLHRTLSEGFTEYGRQRVLAFCGK